MAAPASPLLQVENLCPLAGSSRSEGPAALSLTVAPGEHLAFLGPRGSGKTALARTLALVQPPAAGRLLFAGRDVTRLSGGKLRALRQQLQFVGGSPLRNLPPNVTVREALLEPLQIHRSGSTQEREARAVTVAALLELNPLLLGRKVSLLSIALRQRVSVARAFMLQPRLLVCDELSERLDPAAARPLLELLARACRVSQLAWIWTTTDAVLAAQFSDRVLQIQPGRLSPA